MKNSFLFLLLILVLSSCVATGDDAPCDFHDTADPTLPEGYTFNSISEIVSEGSLTDFQMLSSTVGYIRSANIIFKTIDGGLTWVEISLSDFNRIEDIEFADENTGYISHKSDEGLPILSKTTNGALDWEQIEMPGFSNPLLDLKVDASGNVFGVHQFNADTLVLGDSLHLVKYDKQESAWSVFYRSDHETLSLVDIIEQRLFINEGNRFIIFNMNGTNKKVHFHINAKQVKVGSIDDIYVVTEDDELQGTGDATDSFTSDWDTKFYGGVILIDYSIQDGLLMFLDSTDEYCSGIGQVGSFANLQSRSADVEIISGRRSKSIDSLKGVQKIGDTNYLMLFENKIYALKK